MNRLCTIWCFGAFFWCMHDAITKSGPLSPGVNVFLAMVNMATFAWCVVDEVKS